MAEKYRDFSGDSKVAEYDVTEISICVTFVDGARYLYTHRTPGKQHVDELVTRARSGRGLDTYIFKVVKNNYERKLA